MTHHLRFPSTGAVGLSSDGELRDSLEGCFSRKKFWQSDYRKTRMRLSIAASWTFEMFPLLVCMDANGEVVDAQCFSSAMGLYSRHIVWLDERRQMKEK